MTSAEKREKCRNILQQLNQAAGVELSPAEVAGSRVTELDNLALFYSSSLDAVHSMQQLLEGHIKGCDVAALRDVVTKLKTSVGKFTQFRLLPSYSDANKRADALDRTANCIVVWQKCQFSDDSAVSLCPQLEPSTGTSLLSLAASQPALIDKLLAAAEAENSMSAAIADAEELLQQSGKSLLTATKSKALQHCIDSCAQVVDDTSSTFSGRNFLETTLRPAVNLVTEAVTAISIRDRISEIVNTGPGEAQGDATAILGPEIAAPYLETAETLESLLQQLEQPLQSCVQGGVYDAVATVRQQMSTAEERIRSLCEEQRAKLPQLAALSAAEVIGYGSAGAIADTWPTYIPRLFPNWHALVVEDERVTSIVDRNGEELLLSKGPEILASEPISRVLPALVEAQRETVRHKTNECFDLAHDVAIGRVPFTAQALLAYPTQIAMRCLVRQWTELVEGAIRHREPSADEAADSQSPRNRGGLRHLGSSVAGSVRRSSRPTSAATHQGSWITSPRRSGAEPRPGSASTALFRTGKEKDKKDKKTTIETVVVPPSNLWELRAGSARTRKVIQTGEIAAAPVPHEESTISTRDNLSGLLRSQLTKMQEHLVQHGGSYGNNGESRLGDVDTTKLSVLIRLHYRLLRAWEDDVSGCMTVSDFLWMREPRLYRRNGIPSLEMGATKMLLAHDFVPVDFSCVFSSADHTVWSHYNTFGDLGESCVIVGKHLLSAVVTFASLLGQSLQIITQSTLQHNQNTPLQAHGCRAVLYYPEGLPHATQLRLYDTFITRETNDNSNAERLGKDKKKRKSRCNILPNTMPTLVISEAPTPLLESLVPRLNIEQELTQYVVETLLTSAGFPDSASFAPRLYKLFQLWADCGGWSLSMMVLRSALTHLITPLRNGSAPEAALYEVLLYHLIPRAPLPTLSLIQTTMHTVFGQRANHIIYSQLSAAISAVANEKDFYYDKEVDTMVADVCRYLRDSSVKVLVVRGGAGCGKASTVAMAVAAHTSVTHNASAESIVVQEVDPTRNVIEIALQQEQRTVIVSSVPTLPEDCEELFCDSSFACCLLIPSINTVMQYHLRRLPEGVAPVVQTLLNTHGTNMMTVACSCRPNPSCICTMMPTTLRSLFTLLQAFLTNISSPSENVIKRAFWCAATWSCAPDLSPGWEDFVAPLLGQDVPADLFRWGLNAEGEWMSFTELPAPCEELPPCAVFKRAHSIASILVAANIPVTLVGNAARTLGLAGERLTIVRDALEAPHDAALVYIPDTFDEVDCDVLSESLQAPLRRLLHCPPLRHLATMTLVRHLCNLLREGDETAVAAVLSTLLQYSVSHSVQELAPMLHSTLFVGENPSILVYTAQGTAIEIDAAVAEVAPHWESAPVTASEAILSHAVAVVLQSPNPICCISTTTRTFSAPSIRRSLTAAANLVGCAVRRESKYDRTEGHGQDVLHLTLEELSDSEDEWVQLLTRLHAAAKGTRIVVDMTTVSPPAFFIRELSEWVPHLCFHPISQDTTYVVEKNVKNEAFIVTTAAISPAAPPHVLRLSSSLFDRIGTTVLEKSSAVVEKAAKSLHLLKRLELATTQRSVMTPAERDYKTPEDILPRCYAGTINYTNYPEGPIRVIYAVKEDSKGVPRDITYASLFVHNSGGGNLYVTTAEGGTCRGRLDGGRIAISSSPFEIKVTLGEDGFLTGEAYDSNRGAVGVVGTVSLAPVDEAPTMHWLRHGEQAPEEPPLPEDEAEAEAAAEERAAKKAKELEPEQLFSEDTELTAEAQGKLLSTGAAVSRSLQSYLDHCLRTQFNAHKTATDTAMCAATLPLLATASVEERASVAEKLRAAYLEAAQGVLGDPFTTSSFAAALEEGIGSLQQWLAAQHANGLPSGKHNDHVALFVRLLTKLEIPVCIRDPTGLLKDWAFSMGAESGEVTSLKQDKMLYYAAEPSFALCQHTVCLDASLTVSMLAAYLGSNSGTQPSFSGISEELQKEMDAIMQKICDLANLGEILTFVTDTEVVSKATVAAQAVSTSSGVGAASSSHHHATTPSKRSAAAAAAADTTSVPTRMAALVLCAHKILPQVRPAYALSFDTLLQLAMESLKAPVPTKGTQFEASSRALGTALLSVVTQEDRLLVGAALALGVLVIEGKVAPDTLSETMRRLRVADSSGVEEQNTRLRREAAEALAAHQKAQAESKSRSSKRDIRTIADFLSPLVMPDYPFMGPVEWSRVLCLAESTPALADLPMAMQHGDIGRNGTKEERWADWLETGIGPLPTFEKSTVVTPLDKLLVILALRPVRLVVGLLQFVMETFGDFPDPYATDSQSSLQKTIADNRVMLLLTSARTSAESVEQTVMMCAAAQGAPRILVEHACLEEAVLSSMNSAFAGAGKEKGEQWVMVEGCHHATQTALMRIVGHAISAPASYSGRILFVADVSALSAASARVFTEKLIPRVACNPRWSLQSITQRHYGRLDADLQRLPEGDMHRLMFVVVFVLAVVQQRARFGQLGFDDSTAFRYCERDASIILSVALRYANTAVAEASKPQPQQQTEEGLPPPLPQRPQLPWDAIRYHVFSLIGGMASTAADRDVIKAYVDWALHPLVIGGAELDSGVSVPNAPSMDAHLSVISKMPDVDGTEMIGLHSGCEQRLREAEAERVFAFLEEKVSVVVPSRGAITAGVTDVLNALPVWSLQCDLAATQTHRAPNGNITVLGHVLRNEVKALKYTLRALRDSLSQTLISPLPDETSRALAAQRVPHLWAALSPSRTVHAMELAEWVGRVDNRNVVLQLWSREGVPRSMEPSVLSSVKAFLQAYLHDNSVKAHIPLHTAQLRFSLRGNVGLSLTALRLDGAVLDKKHMIKEQLDGEPTEWWKQQPCVLTHLHVTVNGDAHSSINEKKEIDHTIVPTRPGTAYRRSRSRLEQAVPLPVAPFRCDEHRPSTSGGKLPSKQTAPHLFSVPLISPHGTCVLGSVPVASLEEPNYWVLRGASLTPL